MSNASPSERAIARKIKAAFGPNTQWGRFGDEGEINDCYVAECLNCPVHGVTSYATVGLSRNHQDAGDKDVLVEVLAACASETPCIDNLVSSCVFDSVRNGSNIVYGTCLSNIIDQYEISKTMRHVVFVAPFLWDDLQQVEIDGSTVYFLMALPISDAEREYLFENGIDALEQKFEEAQIDVYDINRPSSV